MSGHSKWATTKRHKAAVDAKRGKIFSILSKEITIAAKSGGGDPGFNPRLRTVINKAKLVNMPADNITKAIKKGTGELPGIVIEEVNYEGYGVNGIGLIVEVTTDNKNRSVAEVRSVFTKNGGNLAVTGALTHSFQHKGQFLISAEKISEDALMEIALEAGAEDIKNMGEYFDVTCSVNDYDKLAKAFEDKNIQADSSEVAYIPNVPVEVKDEELARKVLKLINGLEELEDVKSVFANCEIDDSIREKIES